MVRFISIFALAAVLLTSTSSAFIDGLDGRAFNLGGKLEVTIPHIERVRERVDGTATFRPYTGPGSEWCIVDLAWEDVLQFVGTPRPTEDGLLVLDPGEGETYNSFDKAFGDSIRAYLESRLHTGSLDRLEITPYLLRTTVRGFRKSGEDHLRVSVDVFFRYTGYEGDQSAKVNLKLKFRGWGPEQSKK
jgi:hypothetical protein